MIDRSIIKRTWKGLTECSRFLIAALFLKTFLAALKPFVLLHFSAAIVNGLYAGASEKEILFQAFLLSVSAMAIEIVCHLAGSYVEVSVQKISYNQSGRLSEKAMGMDYQQLEDSRVQNLIESIKLCRFQRGDVFAKEIHFLENLLTGLFVILASVLYICQFVEEKVNSGADGAQFIILLACFGLLLAVAAAATAQNGIEHNKNIFRRFTEVAPINRRYGFYRKDVFQNYKYGKEIRIFDESGLILDEFGKVLKDVGGFMRAVGRQEAVFRFVNNILNVVLGGIAYVYIGINAWQGEIGVGGIVKYSGAVTQLFTGITQVVGALADLKGNERFLRQYYDFLEMEVLSEKADKIPNPGMVEIDFDNVYFKYPNAENWALEGVSFHISNREHVAMVGRNGSGKTTCVRLLMRLYRPDSGRILLNGVDIWQYREEEYWKLMSVVFQDFKIFSFSVRQNIEAGCPKDGQRLWKVICDMDMYQAVEKMYAGAESCLYKDYDGRGVLVSGGEAQKLAIAKALYKDSPIFIMDEPSAALDPVSEAELYEKTNILMREKTMIFISHRLSSCCFCDRIFVWKEGRLTETGSHQQLLAAGGEYRQLWEAQSAGYRY